MSTFDEGQPAGGEERKAKRNGRSIEAQHRQPVDMARLRDMARTLAKEIDAQARARPYATVGAAAGVGFLIGSLFGSRLGRALVTAGAGYVVKSLLEGDLSLERLQENIEKLAHERVRT